MPRRMNRKFKPSRKWKNAVKRVVNSQSETKIKGNVETHLAVSSAAAAVIEDDLSLVAQGDLDTQRIGNDLRAFGLSLKYQLINNSATPSYTRVLVLQCGKDEFDAITDLILVDPDNEPSAPAAGVLSDIDAGLNKRVINRVLFDKVHYLSGTDDAMGRIHARVSKLLKFNHNVKYTATTGDNEDHNLRMWIMARDANTNGGTVITEANITTKYFYKDM